MTIVHHASEATLLGFTAGTLATGPSIVVAAHVAACAVCRVRVVDYLALGGAVLEQIEPAPLSSTALADVLARARDDEHAEGRPSPEPAAAIRLGNIRLPDALRGCAIGRWRWIGPGMHMARVGVPSEGAGKLILLRIGPGRAVPEHGHVGTELTYVVSGSYSDALGRFGPGDLAEADAEVEHQPVVDPDRECVCLAAVEGRLRLNNALGRLLQPLLGI